MAINFSFACNFVLSNKSSIAMVNKGLSKTGIFLLNMLSLLPLFILYRLADAFYVLIFYVLATVEK
jgi:hypothetical protein